MGKFGFRWRKIKDRARSARFKQNRAQSVTIESRLLSALKLASDENVPAKRAEFFFTFFPKCLNSVVLICIILSCNPKRLFPRMIFLHETNTK